MSTLIKSRRMPDKYFVRPGGITEIRYNATPEKFIVLPRTRWLEHRREREARLAAETAAMMEETRLQLEDELPACSPVVDTELTHMDFGTGEETIPDATCQPDEPIETETLSWTDRMRIASTKLIKRQNPWHASLRETPAEVEYSTKD